MNWNEFLNKIGLERTASAALRVKRAHKEGFEDGRDMAAGPELNFRRKKAWQRRLEYDSGGEDEPPAGGIRIYGYKPVSDGFGQRNLDISQDKMISTAWKLYQSNPMAGWLVRTKRNFVLGRGVQFVAVDDVLQEIIDSFDQTNKYSLRLQDFVLQKQLFGEQCFPVFVRQTDGAVQIGYIDPVQIREIVTHPENVLERWAVILKEDSGGGCRIYRIIRPDYGFVIRDVAIAPKLPSHAGRLLTWQQSSLQPWEMQMLNEEGLTGYSGDCFYFYVNAAPNQPRGFSDLLPIADWLDALGDVFFSAAEKEMFASFFSFVVKMPSVRPEDLEKMAKKYQKLPRKGSVWVVGGDQDVSLFSPDLPHTETVALVEALTKWILGSQSFPNHWYGSGDGTNRATAEAQGTPTARALLALQDNHKQDIEAVLTFVRDQAIIAGITMSDEEFDVVMPEMLPRDMKMLAETLAQTFSALAVGKTDLNALSTETISEIVAKLVGEMGVEIDPVDEQGRIDGEGNGFERVDDTLENMYINMWPETDTRRQK